MWSYMYTRICWTLRATERTEQTLYAISEAPTQENLPTTDILHTHGESTHNACQLLSSHHICELLKISSLGYSTTNQIFSMYEPATQKPLLPLSACYLWNGIGARPGHVSIFSKYFTGTTPSKPSVKITLLSEI